MNLSQKAAGAFARAKEYFDNGDADGVVQSLESAASLYQQAGLPREEERVLGVLDDFLDQYQPYAVNPFQASYGICYGCGDPLAGATAEYYTRYARVRDPQKDKWVIHTDNECARLAGLTPVQVCPRDPNHGIMILKAGPRGPFWSCPAKLTSGYCASKNWAPAGSAAPSQPPSRPASPQGPRPSAGPITVSGGPRMPKPISATRKSWCRVCDGDILLGMPIVPWKNERSVWVHEACWGIDIPAKSESHCGVCQVDVQVGDSIFPWQGTKIWVHEGCRGGEIKIDQGRFRDFPASRYQQAIKQEYLTTNSHIIIDAKAGSGKTTTLEWLIFTTYTYPPKKILMMAYNKSIAKELNNRVRQVPGVEASTLNSFGYKLVLRAYGKESNKITASKIKILAQRPGVGPGGMGFPFKREDQARLGLSGEDLSKKVKRNRLMVKLFQQVIDKIKNTLTPMNGYEDLIRQYRIPVEELSQNDYQIFLETIPQLLEASIKSAVDQEYLDFNDQIWLPVVGAYQKDSGEQILTDRALDMLKPIVLPRDVDVLFVDEAQDLNRCQQELALRTIGNGKLVFVGDPFQSIYAFSGADSQSMNRLYEMLVSTDRGCTRMDLSITFRCPKAVVRHAQEILQTVLPTGISVIGPDQATIEAADYAPEGLIQYLTEEKAFSQLTIEGDAEVRMDAKGNKHVPTMILCRMNAPLFGAALKILSTGLPVKVVGRDISKALVEYIDEMNPKNNEGIAAFIASLAQRLKRIAELEHDLIEEGELDPEDEFDSPFHMEKDQITAIYLLACGGPPSEPCMEKATSVTGLKKDLDMLFNGGRCPKDDLHYRKPGEARIPFVADAADDKCPVCLKERDAEVDIIRRPGVILSTVHKSKGLEALKIYILAPDSLGRMRRNSTEEEQRQEIHLYYVAVTRVKFTKDADSGVLTYLVEEDEGGEQPPTEDEERMERIAREKERGRQQLRGVAIAAEQTERFVSRELPQPKSEPTFPTEVLPQNILPLKSVAEIKKISLPMLPSSGARLYQEPTIAIWRGIRDMYLDKGIPAKLTRLPGWAQYALVVNGVACSSTTINFGGDCARRLGKKPIKVMEPDWRGDFRAMEGKKILRTEGWQGRAMERINAIISRREPTIQDAQRYGELEEMETSKRNLRRRNPPLLPLSDCHRSNPSADESLRQAERAFAQEPTDENLERLRGLQARAGIPLEGADTGEITKGVAVALGERGHGTIWHRRLKNADGTALRARVNGRCKVWVRQPDAFRLPVKHGLKECFYVTQDTASEWTTVEPE